MDYLTAWQNGIPLVRPERGDTEISVSAEVSDRHLINSLLAGDEAAFELIFERYKRLVASIAGRFFRQSGPGCIRFRVCYPRGYRSEERRVGKEC